MQSLAIAIQPTSKISTNKERFSRFRYSVVMRLTLLMSIGALVWLIGMIQIGAWKMIGVPAVYLVVSAITYSVCKTFKRPAFACNFQIVVSILFPCLFQIIGGGTLATGAVMLWSIVGLFSVAVYSPAHITLRWGIYTVIVLFATVAFEFSPYFHFKSILNISPTKLLIFNALGAFSIIFYIGFFFVRTVERVRGRLSMAMDEVKNLNSSLRVKNDIYLEGLKHARDIQNAFMKREDQLRTVFTKIFLLREVYNYVSGDFIWAQDKGDYKFVLCGDCRTTGSSRGMLAMLMATTADKVLSDKGYRDPGSFLTAFNREIHEMSSLDLENIDVNVALSMLIIHSKTLETKLSTAGGKILVRDSNTDIVTAYKVDPQCVGGKDPDTIFRSQMLDLKQGDIVYMYTDGLENDAGTGCFSEPEVKGLLGSLDREYMFSQKRRILKEIKQVQGDDPDHDDILVCGFEIEKEEFKI